jgi:Tol biopolymer transport system component
MPAITPPPGVVYRTDDSLWQVDNSGKSVLMLSVSKDASIALSPDGTHILYGIDANQSDNYTVDAHQSNKYSVIDLSTKSETQLAPSQEYAVCDTAWWEAQPATALAMVQPISEVGGMMCQGIPALFSLNGKNFNTIGTEPTERYPFAASPDGKAVAFDQDGAPWLYQWDKGPKPFDLTVYAFPKLTDGFFSNPSWSPSGNQLAWVIAGKMDGEWQYGIGVFNLRTHSSQFLFPYEIEGFDGGRSYIVWSLDEEHVAVWNFGKDLLWVLSVDGTEKNFVEPAGNPVWSPNGKWLAYAGQNEIVEVYSPKGQITKEIGNGTPIKWSPDSQQLMFATNDRGMQMVDVSTWKAQRIDLPKNATVLEWLRTQR